MPDVRYQYRIIIHEYEYCNHSCGARVVSHIFLLNVGSFIISDEGQTKARGAKFSPSSKHSWKGIRHSIACFGPQACSSSSRLARPEIEISRENMHSSLLEYSLPGNSVWLFTEVFRIHDHLNPWNRVRLLRDVRLTNTTPTSLQLWLLFTSFRRWTPKTLSFFWTGG